MKAFFYFSTPVLLNRALLEVLQNIKFWVSSVISSYLAIFQVYPSEGNSNVFEIFFTVQHQERLKLRKRKQENPEKQFLQHLSILHLFRLNVHPHLHQLLTRKKQFHLHQPKRHYHQHLDHQHIPLSVETNQPTPKQLQPQCLQIWHYSHRAVPWMSHKFKQERK